MGVGVGAFLTMRDDDKVDSTTATGQISQTVAPEATQPAQPVPSTSEAPTTGSVVAEPTDQACGTKVEQVVGYTNLELAALCILMTEESRCVELDPDDCGGPSPMAVFGRDVGVSHDGSVPDAVTGQPGPSEAEFQALVLTQLAGRVANRLELFGNGVDR